MDEKISLEAIRGYGDKYAEKVIRDFFSRIDKISGQEILTLCNIQQINLFVIRELFKVWKEENEKLKSPYFDYANEEVKEAMENYMGILSKNISISRENFEPLLKRATTLTLLAVFDPYDYYSMIISGSANELQVEPFREEIKYLKINRQPLERMLQKLEEQRVKKISGNEAFAILDQILEEVNFTPEDVEDYIEKFNSAVPLNPANFYTAQNNNFNEPIHVRDVDEVVTQATQQVQSPTEYVQETPTYDERQKREQRPTLVDNFQRISSIKDSLTINQKFMFTKVLFHGDFELFSKAVDRLDQLDTLQAALRYIENEYASTWDRDSEEFHEFMELVEKRFAK